MAEKNDNASSLEEALQNIPERQQIIDAFKFKKHVNASEVAHFPRTEIAENRTNIVYTPHFVREDGQKLEIVQMTAPRLGILLQELQKGTYFTIFFYSISIIIRYSIIIFFL